MADTTVDNSVFNTLSQVNLCGVYWIDESIGAIISVDSNQDLQYWYTINKGVDWTQAHIKTGSIINLACWFDKETPGDTGDIVHIAWLDDVSNTAFYRQLTIASTPSLGTERTVDSGLTVELNGTQNRLAITKTVSGNLIYAISTLTEIVCYKSVDLFENKSTIADVFETATQRDWLLLFPAATSDDDDAAALFLDRSANEISVKILDQSAASGVGTWGETSVVTVIDSVTVINMDGAIRHSDSHLLMCAHSDHDDAGDDLLTWDIPVDAVGDDGVTPVAKTNIFTNQAESAQVAVVINQQNDDIYVAYMKGGTWVGEVDVVYQKSTDNMGTWIDPNGSDAYSEAVADDIRLVHGGRTVGNDGGRIQFAFFNDDLNDIFVNLVNDIEIGAVAVGGIPIFRRRIEGY